MDNLEELADERDRLEEEERKILAGLGETSRKVVKLRSELQELRKSRDEINETVRALKKTRDQLRDSSKRSLTELRDLVKGTSGADEGSRAEREMADLEWRIQTSSLEKDEEKRLLNRVRILEAKVGAHRKTRRISEDIGKYRKEADEVHAKIQELAGQSQKYHLEVVSLGERFDGLRLRLEEQKKALVEARNNASEVTRKYSALRASKMQSERIMQKEKEKAYKENLKQVAKKKLNEGGKVSLEELGALMGDEE